MKKEKKRNILIEIPFCFSLPFLPPFVIRQNATWPAVEAPENEIFVISMKTAGVKK
jgi:hypothetical protein